MRGKYSKSLRFVYKQKYASFSFDCMAPRLSLIAWVRKLLKKCNVPFERAKHCTRNFSSGVLNCVELENLSFQVMVLECWAYGDVVYSIRLTFGNIFQIIFQT